MKQQICASERTAAVLTDSGGGALQLDGRKCTLMLHAHMHLTSSVVGLHTLPVFCLFPVFVLTQPGQACALAAL